MDHGITSDDLFFLEQPPGKTSVVCVCVCFTCLLYIYIHKFHHVICNDEMILSFDGLCFRLVIGASCIL